MIPVLILMIFFNLFPLVFLLNVECSRVLFNPIKRNILNSKTKLAPVKRFSSSAPEPKPKGSSSGNVAGFALAGTAGLLFIGLNNPSFNASDDEEVRMIKIIKSDLVYNDENAPIFKAVLNDNKEAFLDQIELGANVNLRDKDGVTLFESAIKKGLSVYFDAILANENLDLTQLDSQGRPYLYTAIANRKFHFAREIISRKKITYTREQLKQMIYLASLLLPKTGVSPRDVAEQHSLLVDLFLVSKCDIELFKEIAKDFREQKLYDESMAASKKEKIGIFYSVYLYLNCAFR